MATEKKKKFNRKSERRYEWVTFQTPIYEEEFTFPALKHMTQKLGIAIENGQMSAFEKWLQDAGADQDAIDAFLALDGEEAKDFMEAWGEGQLANAPKS